MPGSRRAWRRQLGGDHVACAEGDQRSASPAAMRPRTGQAASAATRSWVRGCRRSRSARPRRSTDHGVDQVDPGRVEAGPHRRRRVNVQIRSSPARRTPWTNRAATGEQADGPGDRVAPGQQRAGQPHPRPRPRTSRERDAEHALREQCGLPLGQGHDRHPPIEWPTSTSGPSGASVRRTASRSSPSWSMVAGPRCPSERPWRRWSDHLPDRVSGSVRNRRWKCQVRRSSANPWTSTTGLAGHAGQPLGAARGKPTPSSAVTDDATPAGSAPVPSAPLNGWVAGVGRSRPSRWRLRAATLTAAPMAAAGALRRRRRPAKPVDGSCPALVA